jgi:uncharacterized lipoprotein YddW (UPF0748 family)
MGTPRNIVLVAILAVLAALILPAVRSSRPEVAPVEARVDSTVSSPAINGPASPAPKPTVSLAKTLEAKPGPAKASVNQTKPRASAQTPKLLPIQLRGLWVDAFGPGFKTPLEVDKLVRDAQAMRVNALFVQVSRRMDCYCSKSSMPRTADPAVPAGFDPLQDVLDKAHAVGIQVHAWIISTGVWNKSALEYSSTHPYKLHGPSAKGRDNWLTVRADGETQAGADYVLDLGHPDAADYVANMYSSVVQNYAVDGVQFDRIRYPDSGGPPFLATWGYNPTAIERFQLETNRTDKPGVADPQWLQWRRDQVTNLVRRVYLEVKSIRPSVWVSAATITYREAPTNLEQFEQSRTYSEILQDWPAWMREGILDLNIPMNYKREREPDQVKWFDGWNQFAVQQKARGRVAVGTANYLNSQTDGLSQLKRGLGVTGMDGWVGYSYRTPDSEVLGTRRSSLEGQRQLGANLASTFTSTASWDAPSQQFTAVFGRVTKNGLGMSNVRLELRANGRNDVLQVVSDANGYYGFLDVPKEVLTLTANTAMGSNRLELEAPISGVVKVVSDLEMP